MKTKKILIILAAVFVLLSIAFYFVSNYNPDTENARKTSETVIFSESLDNMEEIIIENQYGSYSFTYSQNGVTFRGSGEDINTSLIISLFNSFTKLPAISVVSENSENLSDYGLTDPISAISLKTKNGKSVFYLGNKVTTGNAYYFKTDKNNTVYQLPSSIGDMFCKGPDSFRNLVIVSMVQNSVRGFNITKGGQTLSVSYHEAPEGSYPGAVSTWKITSPLERDADNSLVTDKILAYITSIAADSVAADNPSDISAYGFNGDRVTVKSDSEEISFQVGYKGDSAYIYVEGKNSVYGISPSKLPFMDVKPFDILEKFTNLISIEDISTIEIKTSDINSVLDAKTYKIDEAQADEKAFKSMYMEIIGMSVDGMVEKPVSYTKGAPCIIFNMKDNTKHMLEFCNYDDLNFAVFENGQNTFFMKKTKLTAMLEKLNKFKKDPSSRVN